MGEPREISPEPTPEDREILRPPMREDRDIPRPPVRGDREPRPPVREDREPRSPMREDREIPRAPSREPQPRAPMAVQQAIEEVNQIIDTLRGSLDDMEAVLETLELAERQKIADEQEIETLRRGLRQLHRPREGGQPPPRR